MVALARNPVAIIFNALGDHVLALPALRALSALYQGKLKIIALKGAAASIFCDIRFSEVLEISPADGRSSVDFAFMHSRLAGFLPDGCDLVIIFNRHCSDQLADIMLAISPDRIISFFERYEGYIERQIEEHAFDAAFRLVKAAGSTEQIEHFSTRVAVPEVATRAAAEIRVRLQPEQQLVCLHAETKLEKRWPVDRWVSFCRMMESRYPAVLLLLLSRDEPDPAFAALNNVIRIWGVPLFITCALLAGCDGFVGVDSSLLHIADLARIPGVGLFSPTRASEFGFRFSHHCHVHAPNTLSDLDPHDVFRAAELVVFSQLSSNSDNSRTFR